MLNSKDVKRRKGKKRQRVCGGDILVFSVLINFFVYTLVIKLKKKLYKETERVMNSALKNER